MLGEHPLFCNLIIFSLPTLLVKAKYYENAPAWAAFRKAQDSQLDVFIWLRSLENVYLALHTLNLIYIYTEKNTLKGVAYIMSEPSISKFIKQ